MVQIVRLLLLLYQPLTDIPHNQCYIQIQMSDVPAKEIGGEWALLPQVLRPSVPPTPSRPTNKKEDFIRVVVRVRPLIQV